MDKGQIARNVITKTFYALTMIGAVVVFVAVINGAAKTSAVEEKLLTVAEAIFVLVFLYVFSRGVSELMK